MARLAHLLTCALLLTGTLARAAPFALISASPKASLVTDRGSIRRSGDVVKVWAYVIHVEAQSDGAVYFAMQSEYDCRQEQTRLLYVMVYGEAGKLLSSRALEAQWFPIAPNTDGDTAMREACSVKPLPANAMGQELDSLLLPEFVEVMRLSMRTSRPK
jgi:hypothetical protein